jgi:glutamate carboxypeptidase
MSALILRQDREENRMSLIDSADPFNADRLVETVSTWTRCESPTHDAAAVNQMLDLVAAEFAGSPVALERIPGREGLGDVLIARCGPANLEKPILCLSHVDTVHPVGTLDTLPVRVEEDRLYGPGVYDMKGGVALALAGFLDVTRREAATRPLIFVFTPDEEIGSPTTRTLIEDLARPCAAVLVTEPARDGGKIVTARKGVGRFDVTVTGRPAHAGSRHADGRSAIREAARQILAVEAMTDYARGVTTTVGQMSGGTAVNVIPREARFTIDLRVLNHMDAAEFTTRILNLRPHDPDVNVDVTGEMNRPPYAKTPEIAALHAQARAIATDLGQSLDDVPVTGGGADGNFTAALGIPTLDGLGIDGDGAHTLQEYGLVSSLAPRARLFSALLERLA